MSEKVRFMITCPARTGSSALVSYLKNYEELKTHFAGTDYAVFFDDIVR